MAFPLLGPELVTGCPQLPGGYAFSSQGPCLSLSHLFTFLIQGTEDRPFLSMPATVWKQRWLCLFEGQVLWNFYLFLIKDKGLLLELPEGPIL